MRKGEIDSTDLWFPSFEGSIAPIPIFTSYTHPCGKKLENVARYGGIEVETVLSEEDSDKPWSCTDSLISILIEITGNDSELYSSYFESQGLLTDSTNFQEEDFPEYKAAFDSMHSHMEAMEDLIKRSEKGRKALAKANRKK